MATDFDPDFEFPFWRKVYFRAHGSDAVRSIRSVQRRLSGIPEQERDVQAPARNDAFAVDWASVKEQYAANGGWAFIDPLFSDDFHGEVLADWPRKRFLDPPKRATKWYDAGFWWQDGRRAPKYLDQHRAIEELIASLGSPEFLAGLSSVVGNDLKITEFHITDSGPGAEVPMHQDSLVGVEGGEDAVGIAIFVDGSGGEQSGGLCVSGSSSWRDLIFEPPKLKNTALIYSKKLHHGFRPIAGGKFRKSMNTQFWPK